MTDQMHSSFTDEKPSYEKPQIIPLSDLTAGQGLCILGSGDSACETGTIAVSLCLLGGEAAPV